MHARIGAICATWIINKALVYSVYLKLRNSRNIMAACVCVLIRETMMSRGFHGSGGSESFEAYLGMCEGEVNFGIPPSYRFDVLEAAFVQPLLF